MIEVNIDKNNEINEKEIIEIVGSFLDCYNKKEYNISVAFVGEKEIRKINKKYRKIDKVTDVLSFEDSEDNCLGEVIICFEQIKKQAPNYQHSEKEELIFILVHGLLHLIGYNDNTDEERRNMLRLGEEFIVQHCHSGTNPPNWRGSDRISLIMQLCVICEILSL
ncbi:rRNA maturation RNase YbeY [Candidatus Parcubacteria bacterium]|nr:rRNA maturation RNase YbeY [Candidatus Parcubacteria bacterium]